MPSSISPAPAIRGAFLLRPEVVFLNHGSFGACPKPVFENYQAWQLELERQPVEFLNRRHADLMREARKPLAEFLNVHEDDLVYTTNSTSALNIVARSMKLRPGDEVLGTDHEYGAADRAWRFVCEKQGAKYVNAHIPLPLESEEQFIEAFWSNVTDKTRVIFLSHITSPTAIIFPVSALIRRAREKNITSVIDGAHAPGQIDLNLSELDPDFYAGNCHKWMCAPKGAAFLYASKKAQDLLEPLTVGWGWRPETPHPSRFLSEHESTGTRDIASYLSVPAAIRFMAENDWPKRQNECHELVRYARSCIGEITGLPQIVPDSKEWFAQMASIPFPGFDAAAIKRKLYDEFGVEMPVTEWNKKVFLRISVQAYNTKTDVDSFIDAARKIAVK